jgi:uncharacterized protein (TIGR02285 family)
VISFFATFHRRTTARLLIIGLLLVLHASLAGAAPAEREVVYWYTSDFPPVYIHAGPKRGLGHGDKRKDILIGQLREFRHEAVEAPTRRLMEDLKTKPNVCSVAIVKTPEREATFEFSATPVIWTLPNGVITLRDRLPMFTPFLNERGELRLDAFLSSGKGRRLGIISGRSFGTGIDPVLKKHAEHKSVVTVPSSDQFASRLLKLANQNEFDAIIGYVTELNYVAEQLGLDRRKFSFLPVAEEVPIQPGYVACSKSPFGKRVIAAVNRVLADKKTQQKIEAAYREWLDPENLTLYDRLRGGLTNSVPTR